MDSSLAPVLTDRKVKLLYNFCYYSHLKVRTIGLVFIVLWDQLWFTMIMIGFEPIFKNDGTNWSPVSNNNRYQGEPYPRAILRCENSFLYDNKYSSIIDIYIYETF